MATSPVSRLYVAPTEKSLQRFLQLCKKDAIRASVTEVVYLATVNIDEQEAGGDRPDEHAFKSNVEERIADAHIDIPPTYPVDDNVLGEAFAIYEELAEKYTEAPQKDILAALVEGLPQLSHVCKIYVQSTIDKPGRNKDRSYMSESGPAIEGVSSYGGRVNSAGKLAYTMLSQLRHLLPLSVLFRALKHLPSARITHLSLGYGLIDQLDYDLGSTYGRGFPAVSAVAPGLTHLTLSIRDNCVHADSIQWRDAISSATKLKSLLIYLESGWEDADWHPRQELGTMLSAILLHLTFPELNTFEIIGKADQPGVVRNIWLKAFLDRHSTTLRHLELSGVLLVNWYDPMKTRSAMRSTFVHLRYHFALESAKISLHRRTEHANKACWGLSGDGKECDGTCEQYVVANGEWLDAREIDELAKELAVGFIDGGFAFGEYVMRR